MLCKLKVEGQTLRWYGEPEVLAADSIEFVGFEFILPEDWDGYTLHATFQQDDKAYTQVLEDRKCTLPSEIGVGNCGIGLFGYQPGKSPRATTNLLNVQVVPSGFVPDGEYPVPPTPDLYSQLLSQLDSKVDEAEQFAVSAVQAAQQAQSHANQVKSEADLVVKLADDVAKKATQASDDSTAAAQAKEAAETAKRLAETARDAAETAQKAAETAQSATAQSATDADAAKQAAEAALKSAQNAAGEAANSLSDLRELYQQMQTWAAGVVQDINAEGSNAIKSVQAAATDGVASVNAAGDAQVQRVEYEATHAGDIQVERVKSEGSKYAQMAVDAAKVAQDKAAEIAGKSDQIEANTVGLNELKQDVAAITPDDTTVDGKPWTSKHIVDSLCQPIEENGNPVQCYPVENYPLGVKVQIEPVQKGSGDPSPDNIRPITGRDSVSITVSNSTDSKTTEISLSETVYGGTLDVESGVVRVDKRIIIADGTVNKFNGSSIATYWNMPEYTVAGAMAESRVQNSHFKKAMFGINEPYGFVFAFAPSMKELFATADALNAYLVEQNAAGSPVTFVYRLKTPYTIQLTPQQITALSGMNTLYTDADGVVVTGAEDPKHTITELKNAIISLGGNV